MKFKNKKIKQMIATLLAVYLIVVSSPITVNADNQTIEKFWRSFGIDYDKLSKEERLDLETVFIQRDFAQVIGVGKYTVSNEVIGKHIVQAEKIKEQSTAVFLEKWLNRNNTLTEGTQSLVERPQVPDVSNLSIFNVPSAENQAAQPQNQNPIESTVPMSEENKATEDSQASDLMKDIEKYIESGELDMTYLTIMKYMVIVEKSKDRFNTSESKAAEYAKIIKVLQANSDKLQQKLSTYGMESFSVKPSSNPQYLDSGDRQADRRVVERAKHFQDSLSTDVTSLYFFTEEQKSVDKEIKYQEFKTESITEFIQAYVKTLGISKEFKGTIYSMDKVIKRESLDDMSEQGKLRNQLAYLIASYSSPLSVPLGIMDYEKVKDEPLSESNVQELFKKAFGHEAKASLEQIGLMSFYISYLNELAEAQNSLNIFVEGGENQIAGAYFTIALKDWNTSAEEVGKKIEWLKRVLELLKVDTQSKLQNVATEESALSSKDALSNLIYQSEETGNKLNIRPNVLNGIALSSLYQPLETNAFNNQHLKNIVSTEFFKFHSNYGRLVKHVMISSNAKAASRYYSTEGMGNFRVAKLKDLINNPETEKLLVVSEKYYDKTNIVIDSLKDDDKNAFKSWSDDDFQLNQTSKKNAEAVVKAFKDTLDKQDYLNYTNLLGLKIAKSMIEDLTNPDESVLETQKPIFISTKKINGVNDKKAYFNYLLLKGVKNRIKANYRVVLDLDSPLFADIYGNIITESGLVVIPAAANASLNAKYNFLTVAWLSNCTSVTFPEKLEYEAHSLNNITDWIKFEERINEAKIMVPQKDKELNDIPGKFEPNSLVVFLDSQTLNLSSIDLMSDITARIVFNLNKELLKTQNQYKTNYWTRSVMYPVSKGSYPELINYNEEGLDILDGETKLGLTQALKLERLIDSMNKTIQNTLFTIPDIRFVPGFEMLYYNSLRIIVIITTLIIIFEIYYFTLRRQLSPLSIIQFIVTAIIIANLFIVMPKVYSVSYNSQKYMLQNSLLRIATLNNEKTKNEVEIGVAEGRDPTENPSRIYIKIGEDKINFYNMIRTMMLNEINQRKSKTFQDESSNTRVGLTDDYHQYANLKFADVQELFDSSIIATDTATGVMQQYIKDDPALSFYLPYYVFIDYIVHNINTYNAMIEKNTGSFQVLNDGTVRSVGMVTDYFKSDAFLLTNADLRDPKYEPPLGIDDRVLILAGYDKVGINQIYDVQAADNRTVFSEKQSIQNSGWFVKDIKIDKKYQNKVDLMDKSAVEYIVENHEMLGKLTDETIIKSLALAMALKYNRTFFTGSPQYLEMMQISTYDALRVMISNYNETTIYAPYSYAYMIYKTTGTVGVYIAVFLELVTRALSYVKPLVSMILILIFIVALTFNRVIAKEKNFDLVKGYLKSIAILVSLNFIYAAGLAFAQILSQMGTSSLICLSFIFIVNLGYLMLLLSTVSVIVMNYKDLGNQAFNDAFNQSLSKMSNFSSIIHTVKIAGTSKRDRMRKTVREYYDDLKRRQQKDKYDEYIEGVFRRRREQKRTTPPPDIQSYNNYIELNESRYQTEQATQRMRESNYTNRDDFNK